MKRMKKMECMENIKSEFARRLAERIEQMEIITPETLFMAVGSSRYAQREQLCVTPAFNGVMKLKSSTVYPEALATISVDLMQVE